MCKCQDIHPRGQHVADACRTAERRPWLGASAASASPSMGDAAGGRSGVLLWHMVLAAGCGCGARAGSQQHGAEHRVHGGQGCLREIESGSGVGAGARRASPKDMAMHGCMRTDMHCAAGAGEPWGGVRRMDGFTAFAHPGIAREALRVWRVWWWVDRMHVP